MTKRKYREMVAAIILSVCVSIGAAPIEQSGRRRTNHGIWERPKFTKRLRRQG